MKAWEIPANLRRLTLAQAYTQRRLYTALAGFAVFLMLVSAGCMLQGYGLAGLGFFFVAYMLCYVAAKRLNGLSSVIKYKQDRGEM